MCHCVVQHFYSCKCTNLHTVVYIANLVVYNANVLFQQLDRHTVGYDLF